MESSASLLTRYSYYGFMQFSDSEKFYDVKYTYNETFLPRVLHVGCGILQWNSNLITSWAMCQQYEILSYVQSIESLKTWHCPWSLKCLVCTLINLIVVAYIFVHVFIYHNSIFFLLKFLFCMLILPKHQYAHTKWQKK